MKDRFDLAKRYANKMNVYVLYLVFALNVKPRDVVGTIESIDGVSMGKFRSIQPYSLVKKEGNIYDFIVDLGTSDRNEARSKTVDIIQSIVKDHSSGVGIKRFSFIEPTKEMEMRIPRERELYREFETLMLRGI